MYLDMTEYAWITLKELAYMSGMMQILIHAEQTDLVYLSHHDF